MNLTDFDEFAVCDNGRRIYVMSDDERGQRLRVARGNLNPGTLSVWALLAKEDWTHIIDIGANYGEMLINLALQSAHVKLSAVEPNTRIFPLLERSLIEAGLDVTLYRLALSEFAGRAALLVDDTWSGLSRLGDEVHPESKGHSLRRTEVSTTTLRSILAEGPPLDSQRVLVKIDVEGGECSVLRGLGGAVEDLNNFACLIEVLHLGDSELEWLTTNFRAEIFDLMTKRLVPVSGFGRQRLTRLLDTGAFHRQDIVLRRREQPNTVHTN